ncbi:right-handed parallel beta-helix repeat-containing protein [Haliangium sp. UPWRP_2]|uniref:right-handed parallel beta-helix repeat-containing protein n=1 Tax=Haliangium sp. UPWRP_2 TaxID=1931276 RepID=UPI00130492E0|nr:right-handed parallel beta-helix repeat-containing protein [Haliangium sp. UPWRP_2]
METKLSLLSLALMLTACTESPGSMGEPGPAGAMGMMGPAGPAAPSEFISVTSTGAVGDCKTDNTAAIQTAIANAVKQGGGTVFVPPGCYLVNAVPHGISMESDVSLRLAPGATIQTIPNASPSYSLITVWNKSNVTISGGTLIGDRTKHMGSGGEWGFGVHIPGSSHVTVENVIAREFWGDGFYVGPLAPNGASKNITLRGCVADGNRRQGLSMTGVSGALVDGCTFSNTAGAPPEAGIDLEPNADGIVENVLITNSHFYNNGQGLQLFGGAAPVQRNQAIGNVMSGNKNGGLNVLSADNNLFANNMIQRSGTNGVQFYKSSHNSFTGNYVSENSTINNASSNVVIGTGSSYNNIQGNTCRMGNGTNRPAFGIRIYSPPAGPNCVGNLVTGNDLYQSGVTASLGDPLSEAIVLGGNRL